MNTSSRTSDLHHAVLSNDIVRVKKFFEDRATAQDRDSEIREGGPRHVALAGRKIDATTTEAMVQWNHELNLRAVNGIPGHRSETALIMAIKRTAASSNCDIVKCLLDAGVSPNACDANYTKMTPLHHLLSKPTLAPVHEQLLTLLLDAGARVNARTSAGRTALHMCIEKNHVAVVTMLLERGACPWIPDNNGEVPMHTALRMQRNSQLAHIIFQYSEHKYPDHFMRLAAARLTNHANGTTLLSTALQRTGPEWAFVREFATVEKCVAEHERRKAERMEAEQSNSNSDAAAPAAASATATTPTTTAASPAGRGAAHEKRAQAQASARRESTVIVALAAAGSALVMGVPLLLRFVANFGK